MKSGADANGRLDNLTTIKGIGESRQLWLRETFGVKTFNDLAALSADTIEAQLKAEGKPIARQTIEGWLLHARELSRLDSKAAGPQEAAPVHIPTEWQPFATFVVEFQHRMTEQEIEEVQITTHYMEKDRTNNSKTQKSQAWSHFEQEAIFNWMLAQLHQEAPQQAQLVEAAQLSPAAPIQTAPAGTNPQQMPIPAESRQDEKTAEIEDQPESQTNHGVTAAAHAQTSFSDRLEQVLTKIHRIELAQETHRTIKPGGQNKETQSQAAQAAQALPKRQESESQQTQFSERLQQMLVKVQRIEGELKRPGH